jgi:acetyl-CoA carboxylase carboxyltransferase component
VAEPTVDVAAASVPPADPEASVRLGPAEKLGRLCDAGTLELIRSDIHDPAHGVPGDGVVGGFGMVNGRPIACYAQDSSHLGGSLGVTHGGTIVRLLDVAASAQLPVVSFIQSAGARLQDGTAALTRYGEVFRRIVALSQQVPQISVIGGLSAGGGSYSPALTDFRIMTRSSAMFLTGPGVVREVMGEEVDPAALGGPRVHEQNGVCDLVAADDVESTRLAASLLGYLPAKVGGGAWICAAVEPAAADPQEPVPASPRTVYDIRDVIAAIVDGDSFLELSPRWGRSLTTGFARLDGRPVGVLANQPRYLGGVLETASSAKGARFVATCDRFGLPLVVLVDTPGFLPGSRQEQAGVIRHGADLVRAFAAASVPRITVVVRKAYGGAFIAMNSKGLGASLVFAWPGAEIGIMGAEPALRFLGSRRKSENGDEAAELARYRRQLTSGSAAQLGHVDEVIAPGETRSRLRWALGSLGHAG